MIATTPRLERRLRLSGILISLGLIVEVLTLYWSHPLMFLAFIFLGGLLVGAGILVYLLSIASL